MNQAQAYIVPTGRTAAKDFLFLGLGLVLGLGLGLGLWLGLGFKPPSPIPRELILSLTQLSFLLVQFTGTTQARGKV